LSSTFLATCFHPMRKNRQYSNLSHALSYCKKFQWYMLINLTGGKWELFMEKPKLWSRYLQFIFRFLHLFCIFSAYSTSETLCFINLLANWTRSASSSGSAAFLNVYCSCELLRIRPQNKTKQKQIKLLFLSNLQNGFHQWV